MATAKVAQVVKASAQPPPMQTLPAMTTGLAHNAETKAFATSTANLIKIPRFGNVPKATPQAIPNLFLPGLNPNVWPAKI